MNAMDVTTVRIGVGQPIPFTNPQTTTYRTVSQTCFCEKLSLGPTRSMDVTLKKQRTAAATITLDKDRSNHERWYCGQ
jgi:hypothetical protein